MFDVAVAIELKEWIAPNDYMEVRYNRDTMYCYFKIWGKPGVYLKKTGVLTFEKVWAVRFQRHRRLHYYPRTEKHDFHSYILMIKNSSWLQSMSELRTKEKPGWGKFDRAKYFHYVLQNNDHYIEIISSEVSINYETDFKMDS